MIYYISSTPYLEDDVNLSIASQKFNRLFMKGFSDNRFKVIAIGHFGDAFHDDFDTNNPLINFITLKEKNNSLKYINRINEICNFFKNKEIDKNKDILVYDCLNYINAYAALKFARKFHKTIGIVTDLPEFFLHEDSSFKDRAVNVVYRFISKMIYRKTKFFVFLSENMKSKVNIGNNKYYVLNGFADDNINYDQRGIPYNRKVLYAGSLDKKYGIMNLVSAVIKSNGYFNLDIYGKGDIQNELARISNKYPNINYFGHISYSEYSKKIFESNILVNPRSTLHEFTKYSFPSKNIEYMSTGIPFASTKLCGMDEYNSFVTIIEDETENGILKSLYEIDNEYDEKVKIAQKLKIRLKENNNPKVKVGELLSICLDENVEVEDEGVTEYDNI